MATPPRCKARLCVALLVASALGGCKAGASVSPDRAVKPRDVKAELAPSGPPVVFASKGVPHSTAISLIALDPEGKGALSRDIAGGVRLWAALDGSREPWIVPIRDPRSMALASTAGGGWTLALVDAAGGARIVGVDASGEMQALASLPLTEPVAEIAIMPGGERLLVVGQDHVLRLLDREARELARLDLPGVRLASLRLAIAAEGGPRAFALTAGEFDNTQGRFAVELLALELADDRLALAGPGRTVDLDSPPTADNPTIAPDGRSAVIVQRQRLGGASWQVVGVQLDDGRSVTVNSQIVGGAVPRFGLLPAGRVLLDDGTGLGRIVDLRRQHVEHTPLRTSPTLNHLASCFAGDLRVSPSANWLAVHDLRSDELLYLGYEQISVNDAGLAPSGRAVAWALADRLLVEIDGEAFVVPNTRAQTSRHVDFLDEELLVTLDWSGGVQLIRWTDGELVDEIDVGNHTQTAEFARDGRGNGVMLVRTNLWQNPTLVELRAREFGPRHLLSVPANLAGLLVFGDEPFDHWGAWTIDGAAKLRRSTLDELRKGVSVEAAQAGGELLASGMPEQLAISPSGERLWVRTSGSRPTLHVDRGDPSFDTTELVAGFVTLLKPSPDGRRLAVVQQRDFNQLLTVFDALTLQPLWARPVPPIATLAWSDDAARLAVPAMFGGGAVFDAADGTPLTTRCGLAFESRRSPPVQQGFFQQFSVCEG